MNCRSRDRMVVGFRITYTITTSVVSLNPAHDEVYSIQSYVIKFVNDLRQFSGFLREFQFFSTTKTDCIDITEILLKVALNTITLTLQSKHSLNDNEYHQCSKLTGISRWTSGPVIRKN
jgi:hypothetical protein